LRFSYAKFHQQRVGGECSNGGFIGFAMIMMVEKLKVNVTNPLPTQKLQQFGAVKFVVSSGYLLCYDVKRRTMVKKCEK
jgi:hypothetical protein